MKARKSSIAKSPPAQLSSVSAKKSTSKRPQEYGHTNKDRAAITSEIKKFEENVGSYVRGFLAAKRDEDFFVNSMDPIDSKEVITAVISELRLKLGAIQHANEDEFKKEFTIPIAKQASRLVQSYETPLEMERKKALAMINGQESLIDDLVRKKIADVNKKWEDSRRTQFIQDIGKVDTKINPQDVVAKLDEKDVMDVAGRDALVEGIIDKLKAEKNTEITKLKGHAEFKAELETADGNSVNAARGKIYEVLEGRRGALAQEIEIRVQPLLQAQLAQAIGGIKTEVDPQALTKQATVDMTKEGIDELVKAALKTEWEAKDKEVAKLPNCTEYIAGNLGVDRGVVQPAVTKLQEAITAQGPALAAALEAQVKVLQQTQADSQPPQPPGITIKIKPARTQIITAPKADLEDGVKYQIPNELQGSWYAVTTKPETAAKLTKELQKNLDDSTVSPVIDRDHDNLYRPTKVGETRISAYQVPAEITQIQGNTLTQCGFVESRVSKDVTNMQLLIPEAVSSDPSKVKAADFSVMLGVLDQRMRSMVGLASDAKGDLNKMLKGSIDKITIEGLDLSNPSFSLETKVYLQYFASLDVPCVDSKGKTVDFTNPAIREQLVNVTKDTTLDLKSNAGYEACKAVVKEYLESYRGESRNEVAAEQAAKQALTPDADLDVAGIGMGVHH